MNELKLDSSAADETETDLFNEEAQLAQLLKGICDEEGKELDAKLSAPIMHKLAKVYHKRSPDMFSLIRSAALYNAAILRSDAEKVAEIKHDLQQLCKDILNQASATNKNADLIEKANDVKQAVKEMRDKAETCLSEIKLIPDDVKDDTLTSLELEKIQSIKSLQEEITNDYIKVMVDVASYCESVMGKPKCKFALAGMGSLARKEITPYSDFENILLLKNSAKKNKNYEQILNYFRWYSVIFQIIMINLGETIIPRVAIPSLNDKSSELGDWFYDDFTKSGVSFDGMMPHACKFPLGRQPTKDKPWKTELIKTVSKMLQYMSSDVSLKNGYHLSDILTKTCFVYGDKDVYDEFEKGVHEILHENHMKDALKQEVQQQVEKDLGNFATRSTLSTMKTEQKLNVKQVGYRSTTLFIAALGRICNIRESSCFDIVDKLTEKNEITEYAKHKLMYAVALACEIRLRWYLKNEKQCDELADSQNKQTSATETLLGVVGKTSIVSYFQIAYALQGEIAKRLNLQKRHVYSNPNFLNLGIGQCFDDIKMLENFFKCAGQVSKEAKENYGFDEILKHLEGKADAPANKSYDFIGEQIGGLQIKNLPNLDIFRIASTLIDLGYYDDAEEYLTNILVVSHRHDLTHFGHGANQTEEDEFNVHCLYLLIAFCLVKTHQFAKADQHFQNWMKLIKKTFLRGRNKARASALLKGCLALSKLMDPNSFLPYHETLLEINLLEPPDVANILQSEGECLLDTGKLDQAMCCFDKSLKIRERESSDVSRDEEIAALLFLMGKSLIQSHKPEAHDYFERSIKIIEHTSSSDEVSNIKLVSALSGIVLPCVKESLKLPNVIRFWEKMLHVARGPLMDESTTQALLNDMSQFTETVMRTYQSNSKVVDYMKKLLPILDRLSSNADNGGNIAFAMLLYSVFLIMTGNFGEANYYMGKSSKMLESIIRSILHSRTDSGEIVEGLFLINFYLSLQNKSEEAADYFNRAQTIRQNESLDFTLIELIAGMMLQRGLLRKIINKPDENEQYVQDDLD